jgi:DNA polymerase III delta subunit
MIVIYGVPSDGAPDNKVPAASVEVFAEMCIAANLEFSAETIVVLVSYKPDKRTKFYKYLEKNATVKLFEKPAPWQLKQQVLQWTP